MTAAPQLLVVEDQAAMRLLLNRALRAAGYGVIETGDGLEALDLIARVRPALVVLDVGLPNLSGFEVVQRLRAAGAAMPVLMLTCYGDVESRLRGLGAGADDYLAKPFDLRELLARVQALLRRAAPARAAAVRLLRFGNVTVNLEARSAGCEGVALALTRTEYLILQCLAEKGGQPVSREELLRTVWGYDAETNTRTVETHVWRLRKKIGDAGDEPRWIVNRSGLGYVLVSDPEPASHEVPSGGPSTAA